MTNPETILSRLEMFGVRLGLERMRDLLGRMGAPHLDLPVVLVAGSNGKGSTSALLSAMVGAAGYRVGLYTSPHLESIEERIRVSGLSIESGELTESLDRILAAAASGGGELPTYFEALTLAALLHFRRRSVDLAVLEVGLGGRLDATNVTAPSLSVITSISLDHQKVLGETLAEIAVEKAGILRPGIPAVGWVEEEEALAALVRRASEVGADFRHVPEVTTVVEEEPDLVVETRQARYRLHLALAGRFQRRNAGLAVAAAESLRELGWPRIDAEAIRGGAEQCRWPGRLETVDLGNGRTVLLDAAHNQESIVLLRRHVEGLCDGDCRFDLLFGALLDKAAPSMLRTMSAGASSVVVTTPESHRAVPAAELAESVEGAKAEADPERALELVLDGDGEVIVVCGSIYLVGEIRRLLRSRFGRPQSARSVRIGP